MKGEWVVGREMAFDTMGSRVRVRVMSYSFDLLYGCTWYGVGKKEEV